MSESPDNPLFLTKDLVLRIHADQIERHGGDPGIRDERLLESALAQPPASFGGLLLHQDLFEMAAAYLYHLTGNHPFIDGNKRTGLASALTFLWINGYSVDDEDAKLAELVLEMIERRHDKAWIAEQLRMRARRLE